jgi:uncharacterized protein YjiS (DUF1127 family)
MFLSTLSAAFQRWHRCREAAQLLSGFSDHELKDLGIHRSDILDAVRHDRSTI